MMDVMLHKEMTLDLVIPGDPVPFFIPRAVWEN